MPAIKSSICDEINSQINITYATWTGTAVSANPVSGWDSGPSQSVSSSNINSLADKNIITSTGGGTGYCDIYHLVFVR